MLLLSSDFSSSNFLQIDPVLVRHFSSNAEPLEFSTQNSALSRTLSATLLSRLPKNEDIKLQTDRVVNGLVQRFFKAMDCVATISGHRYCHLDSHPSIKSFFITPLCHRGKTFFVSPPTEQLERALEEDFSKFRPEYPHCLSLTAIQNALEEIVRSFPDFLDDELPVVLDRQGSDVAWLPALFKTLFQSIKGLKTPLPTSDSELNLLPRLGYESCFSNPESTRSVSHLLFKALAIQLQFPHLNSWNPLFSSLQLIREEMRLLLNHRAFSSDSNLETWLDNIEALLGSSTGIATSSLSSTPTRSPCSGREAGPSPCPSESPELPWNLSPVTNPTPAGQIIAQMGQNFNSTMRAVCTSFIRAQEEDRLLERIRPQLERNLRAFIEHGLSNVNLFKLFLEVRFPNSENTFRFSDVNVHFIFSKLQQGCTRPSSTASIESLLTQESRECWVDNARWFSRYGRSWFFEWAKSVAQQKPFSPKELFDLHWILLTSEFPSNEQDFSIAALSEQLNFYFAPDSLKEANPSSSSDSFKKFPCLLNQIETLSLFRVDPYDWEGFWNLETASWEKLEQASATLLDNLSCLLGSESTFTEADQIWLFAAKINHIHLLNLWAIRTDYVRQLFSGRMSSEVQVASHCQI